jgi:hypothetical protein
MKFLYLFFRNPETGDFLPQTANTRPPIARAVSVRGKMVVLPGITRSGINQRTVYSAGNYQLMDEESTRGMVIPLGITSSWTRNQPEEWLFYWELPAHGRGINQRNGYSTGNYLLMNTDSNAGIHR